MNPGSQGVFQRRLALRCEVLLVEIVINLNQTIVEDGATVIFFADTNFTSSSIDVVITLPDVELCNPVGGDYMEWNCPQPLIGTIQQITVVIHSPVTIREVYVFKASDPGRFFGFFERERL